MKDIFHTIFRALYPHKEANAIKREYNLPAELKLKVRLYEDGWFVVTSPDLPGLVTQARNYQELIEMVNDAVLTYFDVPKRKADIVYNKFNIGNQVIQYEGQLQTKAA